MWLTLFIVLCVFYLVLLIYRDWKECDLLFEGIVCSMMALGIVLCIFLFACAMLYLFLSD